VIARNVFTEMSGNGVQTKGGSQNLVIRQNRFVRGGQRALNLGGSTGFEFFRPPLSTSEPNAEARDIRAYANVIEQGLSAIAFVGCIDCLAANNTIVTPERWSVRILQETTSDAGYEFLPAQNGRFANNLVDYAAANGVEVNVGAGTSPETFTFEHNLWYARDQPGDSAPELPVAETAAVIGEDPGYAGDGDYAIDGDSPAATAGVALDAAASDYAGACWRTPPSIGAFEAP
jgi:hypothetical protein